MVALTGCYTFFGITVIDAMLAYNYEHRVDAKSVEDFANDLALSVVFNKFDGYEFVSRRRLSDEPIAAERPIPLSLLKPPSEKFVEFCPCTRKT